FFQLKSILVEHGREDYPSTYKVWIEKYEFSLRIIPSRILFQVFNDRDNGSPAMKTVYEKSLEILKQSARKIMQGVSLSNVRRFALNGLKRMFQVNL
ncbi:hypothetical protein TNCT_340901, partial [Trichonephila clavata]